MRRHSRVGTWVAVGLAVVLGAAVAVLPAAGAGKGRDLVVLDHERWLDTLKGTLKNYGKQPARDVTLIVTFFDKKKKTLGTQRVSLGDLPSGEETSWSLAINEKHRAATRYTFESHAIWK